MLNYNFIDKKAAKEQIDKITIAREYYQFLFLQKLYLQKESDKIYFKGGTAIRFLLQSFRFSEDLDFTSILPKHQAEKLLHSVFDFFIKNSNDQIVVKKEQVFKKIEDISLKYRLLFSFQNSNQKTSIRIDLSLREKPRFTQQTVLVPFDYPISPYPLVIHLSPEELLAEKIRALFVRQSPRDIFDIWFLLTKNITVDEKIIIEKFKYYPNLKFSKAKLFEIIENYDEKELKKDLNQFLPQNYREFYKQLKKQTLKLFDF